MHDRDLLNRYAPAIASLLDPLPLNELGPGAPNETAHARLEALTDAAMWPGQRIVDDDLAACCRAGLWLLHDFLDESHQISQRIDTATGSFWHGIMHRREGDYSNAKYWFRRVGPRHAVFEALAAELQHTGGQRRDTLIEQAIGSHDRWDAARFVDLCQAAAGRGTDDEMLCRRVQQREWRLLFDDCYRGAVENG